MNIPTSASEPVAKQEVIEKEIFINPYHGKEKLTRREAIDCINILSGELLADGYIGNRASQG